MYDELQISMTESPDKPPTARYLAGVYAFDDKVDLAVLRVDSDLDGNPVHVDLPSIPVGDSDELQLGGSLRVLGYPGTGGPTITLASGEVSGFLPEEGIDDDRAWIKTTTTITGGDSGGAALDPAGRLVGVPTQASAGADIKPVDCRPIDDTNDDGVVNSSDNCVPLGGFINGMRPVNLAGPLLERAGSAQPLDLLDMMPESPSSIRIFNVRFREGPPDANPPPAEVFPTGTTQICAIFEYQDMTVGDHVSFQWSHDDSADNPQADRDYQWNLGESGSAHQCTTAREAAMPDGLWELSITEPKGIAVGWAWIGDAHPIVNLAVTNGLDEPICDVYVAPSAAERWGADRLQSDVSLPVGQATGIQVGSGQYDLKAITCEGSALTQWKLTVAGPTPQITVTDADRS